MGGGNGGDKKWDSHSGRKQEKQESKLHDNANSLLSKSIKEVQANKNREETEIKEPRM